MYLDWDRMEGDLNARRLERTVVGVENSGETCALVSEQTVVLLLVWRRRREREKEKERERKRKREIERGNSLVALLSRNGSWQVFDTILQPNPVVARHRRREEDLLGSKKLFSAIFFRPSCFVFVAAKKSWEKNFGWVRYCFFCEAGLAHSLFSPKLFKWENRKKETFVVNFLIKALFFNLKSFKHLLFSSTYSDNSY
jgi:hypothetical protein